MRLVRRARWLAPLGALLVLGVAVALLTCHMPDRVTESAVRTATPGTFHACQDRPCVHFTPPEGWLNDPNGLVYHNGVYHLFYQHNPDDVVWGPMHWGHATSQDLVHWDHKAIALFPDEEGTIFSGSVVVDAADTAGFGAGSLVAVFTQTREDRQAQSIAWSSDEGSTWQKLADNPVLLPPPDQRDFRDPKVFWNEPTEQWIMALAVDDHIEFYGSADLRAWTKLSETDSLMRFNADGPVETPDLFELPVDDGTDTRWVLSFGLIRGGRAAGSVMRYLVGEFDGTTFIPDDPTAITLDHGEDFYAAQSWSNLPDGRTVWIGWMNNWRYATDIPATTWRGSMTVPRELGLTTTGDGIRLTQHPARELATARREILSFDLAHVQEGLAIERANTPLPLDIELAVDVDESTAERFGLAVRVGDGQQTVVGYSLRNRAVFVDRTQSGSAEVNVAFGAIHAVPVHPIDGRIVIRVTVDHSSLEVFSDDGLVTFTELVFPNRDSRGLALTVEGGTLAGVTMRVYVVDASEG